MIPFFSLQNRDEEFSDEIAAALQSVMKTHVYVGGESVTRFEIEFAEYLGVEHVIGVANGLDALRLSLEALGVGAGDEVIVPGFTFIATWLAVSQLGATVVPADVDPRTGNITTASIFRAMTAKTKVVVIVHLYGRPALSENEIRSIQDSGVLVLEDAAQAHGANFDSGKKVGSLGDASAFSFYPTKNLGCLGDGGAIATPSMQLAQQVRELSNYGSDAEIKYLHNRCGWNSRLDPMQAAFLSIFLPQLDEWNDWRRAIAERYLEKLDFKATKTSPLYVSMDSSMSVWHHFVVLSDNRDEFVMKASKSGLQLGCHYPVTPGNSPAYRGKTNVELPYSESLSRSVLSLPIYPQLSIDEQERIISIYNSLGPG